MAVGEIFKESSIYQTASREAIKIFAYFNNQNNTHFIGKLRNIQKEIYQKYIAILQPGDTQWNSYYNCFKSLLKTKQALRVRKLL